MDTEAHVRSEGGPSPHSGMQRRCFQADGACARAGGPLLIVATACTGCGHQLPALALLQPEQRNNTARRCRHSKVRGLVQPRHRLRKLQRVQCGFPVSGTRGQRDQHSCAGSATTCMPQQLCQCTAHGWHEACMGYTAASNHLLQVVLQQPAAGATSVHSRCERHKRQRHHSQHAHGRTKLLFVATPDLNAWGFRISNSTMPDNSRVETAPTLTRSMRTTAMQCGLPVETVEYAVGVVATVRR